MAQCEMCGCYGARETDEWYRYDLPAVWDALCQDCARHENTHTAEAMDDMDLVAAIMLDSGYYASPRHAATHVRRWRRGETHAACERGLAAFGKEFASEEGNLDAMMESARRTFRFWQHESPEKIQRARAKADRRLCDRDLSAEAGV